MSQQQFIADLKQREAASRNVRPTPSADRQYPKVKYNAEQGTVLVYNVEEEGQLNADWSDLPNYTNLRNLKLKERNNRISQD